MVLKLKKPTGILTVDFSNIVLQRFLMPRINAPTEQGHKTLCS